MSIGVDFILRATTDGFTRGMAAANNAVKDIKSELKSFGGGSLAGTIGIAGVIAGFKATLQHAQDIRTELEKMGKPVDAATASVARYADAWDQVKKVVGAASVETLSFFTRAGEGIGAVINMMRGYTVAQQRAMEQSEKETAKSLAAIAEAKSKFDEANSPEKIAAAEAKLAEVRRKNAMEQLDAAGKVNALISERAKLEQDLANISNKNSVSYVEAQTKIAEKDAEISKAKKVASEADAKALAEFTKQSDDSQQRGDAWAADIIKKTEERAQAQNTVTQAVEATTEAIETEAEAAARAHKEFIAQKNKEAAALRGIEGIRKDTSELSDEALQEIIRRNKIAERSLGTRSGPTYGSLSAGTNLGSPEEMARLASERLNAERELAFRSSFRQDLKRGEGVARRNFAGDPGQFDRVMEQLSRMGGAESQDTKTSDAITEMRDILKNTFNRK